MSTIKLVDRAPPDSCRVGSEITIATMVNGAERIVPLITLALVALSQASLLGSEPAFQKIRLTEKFYSEGANFGDINRDGRMDVVSGPFWYEGPGFKTRHEFMAVHEVNPATGYSN